MSSEHRQDAVIIGALILLNVGVAAVCFGLLSSSADWSNGWALGGAIAGFAVSFVITFAAYNKLRTSSDGLNQERQRLRRELEAASEQLAVAQAEGQRKLDELRGKLIRGAPRPVDFDVEVDERQRLVLARPQHWTPRGGLIFSYRAPLDDARIDRFPATFQVFASPFPDGGFDVAQYYDDARRSEHEYDSGPPVVSETVQLGSDRDDGVRSLRVLSRAFVEIDLEDPSGDSFRLIDYRTYQARLLQYAEELLVAAGVPRYGSIDQQKAFGESAERLAVVLDQRFANGSLRATDDHELVEGSHGLDVVAVPGDAHPAKRAAVAAQQGADIAGSARVTDDQLSAALDAGRSVSSRRRTAVAPMGRIRVYCAHEELDTLFVFEFLDDIVDFTDSTAEFDSIMRSVRFLV